MNLPPDIPRPDERRAVPRYFRDGEHGGWPDPGGPATGAAPWRRFPLWIGLVLVATLIVGLWYYNNVS
nr:hypothetical protein [uncultured bacterium]